MKDQAERLPTVVTSHGFNMRQTSFLALHLRSPFPRLRKTNAKTFGGFPTNAALLALPIRRKIKNPERIDRRGR